MGNEDNINYQMDGNMWMATRFDFTNLQESLAGFGEIQEAAKFDLLEQEQASLHG